MTLIALIPTDTQTSRLGLRARLSDRLGDANVLEHTVRRAAAIKRVDKIVLIHPPGQDPLSLVDLQRLKLDKPVVAHMDPGGLRDGMTSRCAASRRWAQPNWRGGLGGVTCYDELLPPGPLADVLKAHGGEAAYIVRGDWCLFDPGLADQQLDLLYQDPEAMMLIFTQAPPGLSGLAVCRESLEQLCENAAGFGDVLAYSPIKPQIDPVGRDVNCPIHASVRDTTERFIYDTPRSIALIETVVDHLGNKLNRADAQAVTDTYRAACEDDPGILYRWLPRMVSLELTPRRSATGPVTPQHYVTFDRPDIDTDLALRIVEQIGEKEAGGDVTLLLGGLGDAMLHPQWERIVNAAHEAGVFGIGIETDLYCGQEDLGKLLDLPIDLVKVRFNADSAETYKQTMGTDGYKLVLENIQWLFNQRIQRLEGDKYARGAMPWLVPSMVKTAETLPELEGFFDKWSHYMGHALIAPACDGCGLMPALSPVPMEPPDRRACLQVTRRMSILSDGMAARCDQDWLGRAPIGDTRARTLLDIWRDSRSLAEAHAGQQWGELTICGQCVEWHRP
jgi:Iron-sulfur cluster-binding domain